MGRVNSSSRCYPSSHITLTRLCLNQKVSWQFKTRKFALFAHQEKHQHLIQTPPASLQTLSDPAQKAQIEALITELSEAYQKVQEAAKEAISDPTNPKKQDSLRAALDSLTSRNKALETALNRAVVGDLASTFGHLADPNDETSVLGGLHSCAKNGDKESLPAAVTSFEAEAERLKHLSMMAMEAVGISQPQLVQEMRIVRDQLEGLAPAVGAAAKMVAENPKDAVAKDYLAGVTAAWVGGVEEMQRIVVGQEGVFKAHELVSGTSMYFFLALLQRVGRGVFSKNLQISHHLKKIRERVGSTRQSPVGCPDERQQ